jgi:membrane protein YdbS with pleckstrin-like domain
MIDVVAISARLLDDGEYVVVSTRTHAKTLVLPAIALVAVAGVAGFLSSLSSGPAGRGALLAIWGAALVAVLGLAVWPFLGWLNTTYTVTNHRLITRSGILTRRGHDIALARVDDVAYEHGPIARLLGCGTLIVSDASTRAQVELRDIPRVEEVHRQLHAQLYRSSSVRGVSQGR